jgi:LPXTG-site transpeptidase (sortase) family protein
MIDWKCLLTILAMPLASYRKATAYYAFASTTEVVSMPVYPTYPIVPSTQSEWDEEPQRMTLWKLVVGMYRGLKNLTASSSKAGLVVPLLFMITGFGFIYLQVQPLIVQQLKQADGYYAQGNTSLVADNYLGDRLQYVSNPGSDYFKQLGTEALQGSGLFQDQASLAFSGTMYLTIPALGYDRLPITANVDSTSEESYQGVLNYSLAHFKGTSLPLAKNPGNTVIYGHSVGGAYTPQANDALSAFSFLSNLKIGDEIYLEINGETHAYRMSKSKIVQPDDFSIVHGTPGRESLTLLTCYPAGNSSQRYVAVATPINN